MQPLQARRLVSALRYICWYDVHTGESAEAPWRVLRHVAEITPTGGAKPIIARPVGDVGSLLLEYSEEAGARLSESQLRDTLRTLAANIAAIKADIEAGADPFELAAAQSRSRVSGPQYLPTALQPEGTGDPVDLSEGAKSGWAPTGTGNAAYSPTDGSRVIQWDGLLADLLDTSKVSESWMRRPKRTLCRRDIVLPARTNHRRKSALVAIDVSGSIDREGVQLFCEAVRNTPPTYTLTVATFDTMATVWADFREGGALKTGGGTDFGCVERLCLAQHRYPDAVVVITDGQGAAIAPKYPERWTWVLYGGAGPRRELFGMRAVELWARMAAPTTPRETC